MFKTLKSECGLAVGMLTMVLFLGFGKAWLADLGNYSWSLFLFAWLFVVMLWASFCVVRHADALAIKLGEPYGTLILTLSVIGIEVIMISAVMLTGDGNPTLGRDMMFSVVMIVMNGLVGLSLLLGGRRHREQRYNLMGSSSYLAVWIPLAVLSLVLPNYTRSDAGGSYSTSQSVFLILITLTLYGTFLVLQTVTHKEYFRAVDSDDDAQGHGDEEHHPFEIRSIPYHALLLVGSMIPIVMLSKSMAKLVDYGIDVAGAPVPLGGFLVAVLVLTPEAIAAVKAAMKNQLQRSVNICLGSALATIGLTVVAILGIGLFTGRKVVLGLEPAESVLLALTIVVSLVTFNRFTNFIQGVIHIVLFATYLMLIFD